jgi:hypothetical protein
VDTHSLITLATSDATQLRLVLQPHVVLVRSRWPLASLWQAHQVGEAGEQARMAKAALDAHDGGAQTMVCWWGTGNAQGVQQGVLPDRDAAWMSSLASCGIPLQTALEQAPSGFDFAAWFTLALRHGWLQGALPLEAAQ